MLPPESPEPGPYRCDRTPYVRRIYQAAASPRIRKVAVVMASQQGKTEVLFNLIGWQMDDKPAACMYVGPTEKQVRSISKDRIDKMLRSTRTLWEKTERGHRYGVGEKFIAGARLGFAWAGSATELASHPIGGMAVVDELDRMSDTPEGSPLVLVEARTKNFANAKVIPVSTPTLQGASLIWSEFLQGTREIWYLRCLHCDELFRPALALLRWEEKADPLRAEKTARVVCPECGAEHTPENKHAMIQGGAYVAHDYDEDAGDLVPRGTPETNSVASFWVHGLCSPWQDWGDLARRLVQAYASHDDGTIQGVINTYGGELFKIQGDAPDWEEVRDLVQAYAPRTIPQETRLLTLGADVQKRGIYYVIRAWGLEGESWLIEARYIAGDTEFDDVWLALGRVLESEIDGMGIRLAFIDSGYRPGDESRRPDHAVYTFCRRYRSQAYPTKGQDTLERPIRFSHVDYTFGGTAIKGGVKLFHLNTDYWKRWIYARIRGAGAFHLHEQTSTDYMKQLVSEELVTKPSGRMVWVRVRRDNHYLDAEVGAVAAAQQADALQIQRTPVDSTNRDKPMSSQGEQSRHKRRSLF